MLHRLAPFVILLALTAPAAGQPVPAGTGTIYVGSYSGHITAIDEATEAVTKIPLKTGAPWVVRPSPDRTRFYVQSANQEHFEIVDIAGRKSIDTFTLSQGRRHVRAIAFDVDPQHRTMVLVARTATRLIDRWEVGAPEFVVYDLAEHRVVRTVPWTADPEPGYYGTALRYSPDGKLLYVFGTEVVAYDVATFQQVDSWDLSLPTESGLGRFEPGFWDDSTDPQGSLTSLFTMRDPIGRRTLLVVGRLNMVARTLDYFPLGPAPTGGDVSFFVAPDQARGYLLHSDIGRHELWAVDMKARRVLGRQPIPGRTRMQVRSSSSGQALYLYQAGRTIDLHAPEGFRRLRTITLDSDMMYGTFYIFPASAGR